MVQIDNSRYSAYGYDQRLEVFGESGMVATQNILEDAVQITDELGHHTARSKHFFVERYSDSYRNILMDFIATLKNKQAPSISADDGLAALVIAMAAKQSAKENRPISLS
jgi:myo-inositol 2-dehydrogenase/D-chiro-inositol 1-dehydrogenase